ncbi:SIMPL domain-containing protein [Halorussus salilacus]|uniref:SIMPL domain-containing protein n=1 Tax=Halorussus salilacus TaxID=2953750 RepID=UPI00209F409D|nr:SIMPL domain-containing protein [Halorussus salilacus]USZ68313.1 SIMPL domain-containing protein [Halorussus salilacus]
MTPRRLVAPLAVALLLVTAGCAGGVSDLGETGSNEAGVQDGTNDVGAQNGTNAADASTVGVGATGEVTAEPDRALVGVGVEATADDPETARQRVAENVSDLRDALADIGLDDDQVTTERYAIREDRESRREGGDATAYRATHSFELSVEDVDEVGTVIQTAVANGATDVGRVEFTLSEEARADLREEALADAMDNARADAEVLATNANLTLAGVDSVSTDAVDVRPYRAEADMAATNADTEIESGPVSVTAQVRVTYEADEEA